MATATYTPIVTQTLGSAASSITFSSIPSTYTDLRLVLSNLTASTTPDFVLYRFNGDTASNYSWISINTNGTAASSVNNFNATSIATVNAQFLSSTVPTLSTIDIFSYAGSTNKTALVTVSGELGASVVTQNLVGLWRATSAITSITVSTGNPNINAGTIATLWGI